MIEPIELSYDLHPLPPGRTALRRWRWELWHGPRLLAAGWRLNALHAQRAIRVHALRYAHRLHGLHPLGLGTSDGPERTWAGQRVAIDFGEVRVLLEPRALLEAQAPAA